LVALAPSHREFLCGRYRLTPDRFTLIPNGADTARFHPASGRDAARRSLGWPAGGLVVGIVAALRPEKNHTLFLRTAATLTRRGAGARFVIVGDGPERARLEREAGSLGLGDHVAFLGAREDTPELYRAMDVAVLSSHPVIETFPMALIEAQASGVPVVSTDVGSVRDVVAEGESGFIVPPGHEAALADAIARLLADAAMRERMGRAGRERAVRFFAREGMIRAYERLFEEVGSGDRASPAGTGGAP